LEVSNFNFFFRSVQDILIIYYELKNRVNSANKFSPFDIDVVRKFENVFYSDETYGGDNVCYCADKYWTLSGIGEFANESFPFLSFPEIALLLLQQTSTTLLCARWAEQGSG